MGADTAVVRRVLAELGNPQDAVPVVLLAGTNGKGSVAAMVESMARAAGYRAGLFHSPALGEDCEQIRIDGEPLSELAFARWIDRADRAAEAVAPGQMTWFEATTLAAYLAFADPEAGIDLAIVEAGLGGEDDCTNVPSTVVASALVTVGLEHRRQLGATRALIARNKAGIFRRGRPALLGWLPADAKAEAWARADELGARVESVADHLEHLATSTLDPRRQRLELRTAEFDLRINLQLPGTHQGHNAALAVRLIEHLRQANFDRLDGGAVAAGLEGCRWPGRLEWLDGLPRPVLLDVAHDPDAQRALVAYLEALPDLEPPDLLYGAFDDKDHRAMFEILAPRVGQTWLTAIDHPRATAPNQLADRLPPGLVHRAHREPSLPKALDRLMIPTPTPLLVTGSMHLVGRARRFLLERRGARSTTS